LVRRFHVLPQCVAVLSQHPAQCTEIEKELLKRGLKDITVSTVAAAQGKEIRKQFHHIKALIN